VGLRKSLISAIARKGLQNISQPLLRETAALKRQKLILKRLYVEIKFGTCDCMDGDREKPFRFSDLPVIIRIGII